MTIVAKEGITAAAGVEVKKLAKPKLGEVVAGGGAVFWSGNKEGAAAYANSIGGTIMEQTLGAGI